VHKKKHVKEDDAARKNFVDNFMPTSTYGAYEPYEEVGERKPEESEA
jgi:hypothetical protein